MVGCGNIAQSHWRGIQHHAPEIEVTAVVDSDPDNLEAMSNQTGATGYLSLDDALLAGDFEAVDLMLPHDLHVTAALASFSAGKHVLLEKPMAPTLNECEQIINAAHEAGTTFMIAEQAQYWPDVHKANDLIKSGTVGEIISARGYFRDLLRTDPDNPVPWRFKLDKSGGGISIDGGAHWIRPLRMWLGEVDEVIAATSRHVPDMEGESLAHAMFRFTSGKVATFDAILSAAKMASGEAFRITGTKGEILIEHGREGKMYLFNEENPSGLEVMETLEGKLDSYGLGIHDFSQVVLHGKKPEATAEYSLGELRTALAMYRSVETKKWEKVWS